MLGGHALLSREQRQCWLACPVAEMFWYPRSVCVQGMLFKGQKWRPTLACSDVVGVAVMPLSVPSLCPLQHGALTCCAGCAPQGAGSGNPARHREQGWGGAHRVHTHLLPHHDPAGRVKRAAVRSPRGAHRSWHHSELGFWRIEACDEGVHGSGKGGGLLHVGMSAACQP